MVTMRVSKLVEKVSPSSYTRYQGVMMAVVIKVLFLMLSDSEYAIVVGSNAWRRHCGQIGGGGVISGEASMDDVAFGAKEKLELEVEDSAGGRSAGSLNVFMAGGTGAGNGRTDAEAAAGTQYETCYVKNSAPTLSVRKASIACKQAGNEGETTHREGQLWLVPQTTRGGANATMKRACRRLWRLKGQQLSRPKREDAR